MLLFIVATFGWSAQDVRGSAVRQAAVGARAACNPPCVAANHGNGESDVRHATPLVNLVVKESDADLSIAQYLTLARPDYFPSPSSSRKVVRKGIVHVNGVPARCERLVASGDHVRVLPRRVARTQSDGDGDQEGDASWWTQDEPLPEGFGLLTSTREELAAVLGGRGRAAAVWDCLRSGTDPMEAGSVTARTKSVLALAGLRVDAVAKEARRTVTRDGTAKLLLTLSDGLEVETVLIPWVERRRTTICVSSQVGCAQACSFCATGRMGRLRSLTAEEIAVQAFFGRRAAVELGLPAVEGVVFMGMGEPSDAAPEVVRAARALADDLRFRFSRNRITISTVAPSPEAFEQLAEAGCVLAWSVHAANDTLRRRLVPTTRHTMVELRDALGACLDRLPKTRRQVMIEVTLIDGVNDRPQDAKDVLEFLQPLQGSTRLAKVMVDLIPYNAHDSNDRFRRPSFERVSAYQALLRGGGMYCFVRSTRGDDGNAACGQLATRRLREARVRSS